MSSFNFKIFYLLSILFLYSTISFSAPAGIVTLNSPADGTTNIQTPVSLVWTAPTNTDFFLYTIQIATDASFQTPIINENTTTTIYSVSRYLTSNTKFFWRVLALQKLNLNAPTTAYYISNPWVFYTADNLTPVKVKVPGTPTLLTPTNNLTTVPLSARLIWNSSSLATSYSLQLSIDNRFTTSSLKISKDNLLSTTYDTGYVSGTLETILKPGTRYYWRVRAVNAGGVSAWSNFYSFITTSTIQVTPPPSSVELMTPGNGVTLNLDSISNANFLWGSSAKATSYTLQISTDITFTTLKKSVTTTATNSLVDISNFEATRFYWRVLATNSNGSAISAVRMFTVMPPMLISPLNGEIIEDDGNQLIFRWDNIHYVSDITSPLYDPNTPVYYVVFQYADNPNFINATSTLPIPTTSYSLAKTTFTKGVTYYWRLNISSYYSYTSVRSFKIIASQATLVIPTAPVLNKPANNTVVALNTTLNADAPIIFDWSPAQAGVSYTLTIASNNTLATVETTINTNTLTASIAKNSALLPVGDHYWRVLATNANGASKSEIRKFTIKNIVTPTAFSTTLISLTSPTTSSIVSAASVKLSWKDITNPTAYGTLKYNLQISSDINMTNPILDTKIDSPLTGGDVEYAIGSDFGTTKAILVPGTKYYWRVNLNDSLSGLTTNWSTVWCFTTEQTKVQTSPSVPALVSPADTATGIGLNPTFCWNPVDQADYYHFQLSTSNTFASILYDKDQVTSISVNYPITLNLNTTYYWRVQSVNIVGISAYTTGQFTTRDTTEAPLLLTPANDGTTGNDAITFSWNTIAGVTAYQYDLSSDNGFANILLTQTIASPTTSTTITNADVTLVKSNRYYWRVFGKTGAGLGQVSPVWSFTIQTDYLPANGAINQALKPVLSWPIPSTAANAQISYQIQVSKYQGFDYVLFTKTGLAANSIIVQANDTSAVLSNNTTYYWHVNTIVNGISSGWSFPYRFTTLASLLSLPGKVTLLTPVTNTLNVDTNGLTFNWNLGANASSYNLQISTSASFSPVVLSQTGIANASYTLSASQSGKLLPNKNYYWRVQSENATGTSAWSTYFVFKTKQLAVITLVKPILILPVDNSIKAVGAVTFTYYPVSGATGYNLVIANASDFNVNSIIADVNSSTLTPLTQKYTFLKAGTYYWHVKAIRDLNLTDNIIDGESEFSAYRTLIIQ
jgi:hypothetical protein